MEASTVERFASIFSGSEKAHGVHIYSKEAVQEGAKKGKREGKSFTKLETVELRHYQNHIEGIEGLGIIPIMPKGLLKFAVIDIDDYSSDLGVFRRVIHDKTLPFFPFTSKSGGLHIYTFFEEAEPAKDVIKIMQDFVSVLGLPKSTEVFPKQDKLKDDEHGNWINLPYYNNGEKQYLLDRRGLPLKLEEMLDTVEAGKTTLDGLKLALSELPVSDGPPCIQAILLRKTTDNRNNFMFSYGVYCKAKWQDDFASHVMAGNNTLDAPLPESEIKTTVIKSLEKETYAYKCKQAPLVDFCNKELCKSREFGVGSGFITGVDFGALTQVKTNPPHYIWNVGTARMQFESEADIMKQDKFRALCFRELYTLPHRVKDDTWTQILQRALENIIIEEVEAEDLSEGAQMWAYIEEYLVDRAHSQNIQGVAMNQVFVDVVRQEFVFKGSHLSKFLRDQKGLRDLKHNALYDELKQKGAQFIRERVDQQKQVRAIRLPFAAVEYNHEKAVEERTPLVDFSDERKEAWD